MRRLPNGGGVGAGNDERRGTMAGRGGRAVPRGQARGQAQGQAVAAGTSSRRSLLMLAEPPGETAKLTCFSCNIYILCESVRGRAFERG